MHWYLSHRADPPAVEIADRHYNRQKIGTKQFVKPGRCLVLLADFHNTTEQADALWVTSWPDAQYVKHKWAGAWECSYFRNESSIKSSVLIAEAVAVTRWYYENPPELGFITFVNASKIRSINPGCCYKKAGWKHVGFTKSGLVALQLLPEAMPESCKPADVLF